LIIQVDFLWRIELLDVQYGGMTKCSYQTREYQVTLKRTLAESSSLAYQKDFQLEQVGPAADGREI
jgi:hypothetical protein